MKKPYQTGKRKKALKKRGDVNAYEHRFQVNPQAMDPRLAFQDPLGVG